MKILILFVLSFSFSFKTSTLHAQTEKSIESELELELQKLENGELKKEEQLLKSAELVTNEVNPEALNINQENKIDEVNLNQSSIQRSEVQQLTPALKPRRIRSR